MTTTVCLCGHPASDHREYVMGANRRGSRFVCTRDGCQLWNQCDLGLEMPARGYGYVVMDTIAGPALACLDCLSRGVHAISFNPSDVEQHYCGACHRFLDDVVPPENAPSREVTP